MNLRLLNLIITVSLLGPLLFSEQPEYILALFLFPFVMEFYMLIHWSGAHHEDLDELKSRSVGEKRKWLTALSVLVFVFLALLTLVVFGYESSLGERTALVQVNLYFMLSGWNIYKNLSPIKTKSEALKRLWIYYLLPIIPAFVLTEVLSGVFTGIDSANNWIVVVFILKAVFEYMKLHRNDPPNVEIRKDLP